MEFEQPLIKGTLIKRYKRFLADVELPNGDVVVAHCPNTGAMTGCAEPGYTVWLSQNDDPKRKLKYTWELAQTFNNDWIGINTHRANRLVEEAIQNQTITELANYETRLREQKYGDENSKIDFLLRGEGKPDCYVEVKSVTLLEDSHHGYFPDTKTARGTKHLRELAAMRDKGVRCVLIFCVQHSGVKHVSAAAHIDPEYQNALQEAIEKGVEVYAWQCCISDKKIQINQSLPFLNEKKG
ncbi:DNA/RNA nuclease SfsA [Aestuariibacter sp. AA17]|uniref:Sugar fermentation stimulation protein homolog n=1 Tax=Fluctibacter corallii TaxID=2984329 RepID=A0ABT3AAM1_9ALTE|nr:DNA/RNA nuclease SfsA [Aestuariibacter sp. AA17]MCV2885650.1 DNA/RNA nuclease SfsA [Aestuariibacter sp. AA17]